jgi:hypothetical protein
MKRNSVWVVEARNSMLAPWARMTSPLSRGETMAIMRALKKHYPGSEFRLRKYTAAPE